MTINIGRAFVRGTRRSVSTSGFVVLVLSLLTQLGAISAMNTLIVRALPNDVRPSDIGTVGFTLPVSSSVAVGLGVGAFLLGLYTIIIASRLLTRDTASLSSIPASVFTRRLVRAYLSIAVVSILLAIAIPLGFAMVIVPGLFLAVSFQFAVFAIAVEDTGPIEGLKRSWELATGNRWRLVAILLVVIVFNVTANIVGTVVTLADPTIGQFVSLSISSVFLVLLYGILGDVFVQLTKSSQAATKRL